MPKELLPCVQGLNLVSDLCSNPPPSAIPSCSSEQPESNNIGENSAKIQLVVTFEHSKKKTKFLLTCMLASEAGHFRNQRLFIKSQN